MNCDTKIILLHRVNKLPLECLVNSSDYEWLVAMGRWATFIPRAGMVYAGLNLGPAAARVRGVGRRLIMHRVIMNAGTNVQVDHKNRNTLDNRRSNLRLATPSQNNINRGIDLGEIDYRGVTRNGFGFSARISLSRNRVHIGTFPTAIEAARAYDRAAIELHGEFAVLNFPNEYAKAG